MKAIRLAITLFFLATPVAATIESDQGVFGPFNAVKAFKALRERDMSKLIHVLNSKPSPVNETLSVTTASGDVQFQLVHAAALTKDERFLRILQTFNVDVGAKDSAGRTGMHYVSFAVPELSALFGYDPAKDGPAAALMVRLLFFEGLDPNLKDLAGKSPMHHAAAVGQVKVMRQLLGHGVEIDPRDAVGLAPIHYCLNGLYFSCVDFLQDRGSAVALSSLDYVVGFKNKSLSFVTEHAAAVVLLVTGAISALLYPCMGALSVTHNQVDQGHHDEDHEEGPDLRPNDLKVPAPTLIPHQVGSGMAAVAPASSAAKIERKTGTKKKATVPKIKTELVAYSGELQAAVNELNGARKSADESKMLDALIKAGNLLSRLEGTELISEDRKQREYVIAAMHSIQTLSTNSPFKAQAKRLLKPFEKYRTRR